MRHTGPKIHVPLWAILPLIFFAVLAAHFPLLRLPYYWDEAGYYIPAAFDFFRTGALIPYSTLSNGHPPLPSIWLTLWWKIFHFAPIVTRISMCLVAAIGLTAVWRLAIVATGRTSVAVSTVLLTAVYPVFFAQSSLAHADMFAAAATLWGLVFLMEERFWLTALAFSIAALCKETSIVTPAALALWIAWRGRIWRGPDGAGPSLRERLSAVIALLVPILPLTAWYAFYWSRTGFLFGNPQYFRYNATATLNPERILIALGYRIMHITIHMNLFVPVALMLACLLLPPVQDDGVPRPRISAAHLAVFGVVIATNVVFYSVLGGALLTRYLLPLYPLILLIAVNTFRRRLREWSALVALSAAAFVIGLFVNPPYRFAPEDNLEYVTDIHLQQAAIHEIVTHYPGQTVLTAWPVSDEMSKPELGYVTHPVSVVAINNFSAPQIAKADFMPRTWTVMLAFSTKYDPPSLPFGLGRRSESWDKRYFGFHRDLPPQLIARALHGGVVWAEMRKYQWAAVIAFPTSGAREARLTSAPGAGKRQGSWTAALPQAARSPAVPYLGPCASRGSISRSSTPSVNSRRQNPKEILSLSFFGFNSSENVNIAPTLPGLS